MIPASPVKTKCPTCRQECTVYGLRSGNTFNAVFWTDGYVEAPMLPDIPALVRCPHCTGLFWPADIEGVKAPDLRNLPPAVLAPTETDIYEALQTGLASDEDLEKYLRTRAWRESNHGDRTKQSKPGSHPARRRDGDETGLAQLRRNNLDALVRMCHPDNDDSDRLMVAEIAREHGDFDRAVALLDRTFDLELADAALVVHSLAKKRVADLAITRITSEEPSLRCLVLETLKRRGGSRYVKAIADRLRNDVDAEVRTKAAEVLEKVRNPETIPDLEEALSDAAETVRREVTNALSSIGPPKAAPGLLQALQDDDEKVRWTAALALSRATGSEVVDVLRRALAEDRSAMVRERAATALGYLLDDRAFAPLERAAVGDPDPEVRKMAANASQKILANW